MKFTHIADFKLGRSIKGFYLCKEKHLRHTRNGDLYLDMMLTDSTGMVPGKMWELVNDFQNRFESGDPVAVKGKVGEFNDLLQLTVTQINRASSKQYGKYGYSPEILLKKVDEPIDSLWRRLIKISDTLKQPCKDLVTTIFNQYKDKIQTMPASVNHHHPVFGGFLKHMVTTSEISMEILKHYPSLNRDLLLAGILLHDIGKVKSINEDLAPGHTDEGKLIGHIVLGRDIVLDTARAMKKFPEDILTKLEHIILSNQGMPEEGPAAVPQFPEALFVYYIDKLDARLNLMLNAIENDPNINWTGFQSKFRAELFKK